MESNSVFFLLQDRSILPSQYTRVPTGSRAGTPPGSNIASECASSATLVSNASPFTSQVELEGDNSRRTTPSRSSESPESEVHYYAGNLLSNQGLKKAVQIYNHQGSPEYEQLNPLLSKHSQQDQEKMFHSQEFQVKMGAGPPFKSYFQAEGPTKKKSPHYFRQVSFYQLCDNYEGALSPRYYFNDD